ncbi:FAD/NAD(P)-binding domain [Phytophthora cactorum]|nr:FAD/NAD(P)-binding domain [Phytophthora cactorum]
MKTKRDHVQGIAKLVAKDKMRWPPCTPTIPDLPGMEHVIDSDGFFRLEQQPKKWPSGRRLHRRGAGRIFNVLKSDTNALLSLRSGLRKFDPLCMEKAGVKFVRNVRPPRRKQERQTHVRRDYNGEEQSSRTLTRSCNAIGREPRTKDLGLEEVGVKLAEGGFIEVDAQENTSVAVCTLSLTPVAIAAGRRLSDRLFGGEKDACLNYHQIPTVIFSTLLLARSATLNRRPFQVYSSKFVNLLHSMADPERKGKTAMKLVTVGEKETVVGVHVAGEGADEMIQGFGVAADFDNIVAIHPTAAEELVTMAPWGMIKDKIVLSPEPARPAPTPKQ